MTMKKLNAAGRRSFLKLISLTGLAGLFLPRRTISSALADTSRVVLVTDSAATDGTPGGAIDASVVRTMIDSGITALAGTADISDAWKTLLPGITSSSIVAIKVSAKGDGLPVHPEVALAVGQSLAQTMIAGTPYPENNIIIYERSGGDLRNCGYTINKDSTGVRVMGTDAWSDQTYDVAGQPQHLSTFVTDDADYLISLAVLKNHEGPGVTLCMKNHYGTCDAPSNLHEPGNLCDPYIAALNALDPIRTKQKLGIIDGLFGIRSGGPGGAPQFTANAILMSTDVVAVDTCGLQLLKDNGCTTTGRAGYIGTAADDYGLGTNDPSNIDLVSVINPSSTAGVAPLPLPSTTQLLPNYPNPFNPTTSIRYRLSAAAFVRLQVTDVQGRRVALLAEGRQQPGEHRVQWNAGHLASGIYFCRLEADGKAFTNRMVLTK